MDIRINILDLPSRPKDEDGPVYQLTYQVDGKRQSHLLGEGEICIGSSTRSDLRIRAAGVRSRHVRLKRHGDKVFIQSLSSTKIILDGKPIEGLTPLAHSQSFAFGSVTATVELIAPPDRQHAVRVQPVSIKSLLEDDDGQIPNSAVQQLGRLNEALEEILQRREGGEVLLEALRQALAPMGAALFRRRVGGGWALMAEFRVEGAPPTPDPEMPEEYSRFSLQAGDDELLLLVLFSDDAHSAWRREVCRQVLILASLGSGSLSRNVLRPEQPQREEKNPWQELVGSRIRAYLSSCQEMCRCSDTVLILGETGTGKELVARGLHRLWGARGEFIALNCAAIPAELLDAELFGIEAGTATGVTARRGRIEQAQGGTLFLDEISELPLPLQSKLLRVLQERSFFSLGGKKLQQADIKIVAASNKLSAELRAGGMRQDLYFRLTQALVSLPPLRERSQDLAALCEHFLSQLENQFGRGVTGLSVSALKHLKVCNWPGNVRELQNLLRYLYATVAPGGLIQSFHLPAELQPKLEVLAEGGLVATVKEVERQVIERELQRHNNIPAAARALGLSEGYLYRKVKKLGLRVPELNKAKHPAIVSSTTTLSSSG